MPFSLLVRRLALPALGFLLGACRDQGPDSVFRINVLPARDTLAPGSVVQLTAEVLTEDGRTLTGRVVTWFSSNPAVAQVSSTGLVTAMGNGSVTIEAKSEGRRNTSWIIVREPVAAMRFVTDVVSIDVHDGFVRPQVDLVDRDGNVVLDRLITWETSNPAVALVNAFGEIDPVAEGDAIVVARSEGHQASVQVQVRRLPVASVRIDPATTMVFESLPLQLRAVISRADGTMLFGRSATWSSSDASILAVDASGRLTTVQPGTVSITAVSEGVTATVVMTVLPGSATVSVGGDHTCALSAAALAWCWGANTSGQLGANAPDQCSEYWYYYYNESYPCARSPLRVETDQRFRELSAGEAHSCALTLAGQAWCWGNNLFASLGVGQGFATITRPAAVQTSVVFKTISAGTNYTCGIDSQDQVHCWGYGPDGQLGIGDDVIAASPVRVPTATRFASLSAGVLHTCGIALDSSIWCWGANWRGQLGNGTNQPSRTPVQVAGRLAAVRVSVGLEHTCAVTVSNDLFCWGGNTDGQLGSAAPQQQSIPLAIAGDPEWKTVSVGGNSSCAIDLASLLYCWGSNAAGQLGHGGFGTGSQVPAPAMTTSSFVSVSINRMHACGRSTSGLVFCWGSSNGGALGTGTSQTALPTRVIVPQ